VARDPIEAAALLAATAQERARCEREMEAIQGDNSRWREVFGHAAEVHERAAALQTHAVSQLLMLRYLRDEMLLEAARVAHDKRRSASRLPARR
jgi:hypothetical protein